jgi:hypothetical protein
MATNDTARTLVPSFLSTYPPSCRPTIVIVRPQDSNGEISFHSFFSFSLPDLY